MADSGREPEQPFSGLSVLTLIFVLPSQVIYGELYVAERAGLLEPVEFGCVAGVGLEDCDRILESLLCWGQKVSPARTQIPLALGLHRLKTLRLTYGGNIFP